MPRQAAHASTDSKGGAMSHSRRSPVVRGARASAEGGDKLAWARWGGERHMAGPQTADHPSHLWRYMMGWGEVRRGAADRDPQREAGGRVGPVWMVVGSLQGRGRTSHPRSWRLFHHVRSRRTTTRQLPPSSIACTRLHVGRSCPQACPVGRRLEAPPCASFHPIASPRHPDSPPGQRAPLMRSNITPEPDSACVQGAAVARGVPTRRPHRAGERGAVRSGGFRSRGGWR
jgi:hypothetical protein